VRLDFRQLFQQGILGLSPSLYTYIYIYTYYTCSIHACVFHQIKIYDNIWIFEWVYIYMVYIWYIYGIDVCSTSLRCRHHFSIPSEFSSSALDLQSAGRKPYTATGERSWCSIANCWMTQGYVETMRNTDHTDLKNWRIVWFHVFCCFFFRSVCLSHIKRDDFQRVLFKHKPSKACNNVQRYSTSNESINEWTFRTKHEVGVIAPHPGHNHSQEVCNSLGSCVYVILDQ
jgi:hypothetical protein